MAMRTGSGVQYDGCEMTYTFKGERVIGVRAKIDLHVMYSVRMNRGLWWLSVNGQHVETGADRVPSRANARKIVLDWKERNGLLRKKGET